MYCEDDFNSDDDVSEKSNKTNDADDENLNTGLGVVERTNSLSQSCKDRIKNIYDHIIKQGKNITSNNGLTSEVLGFNGYLSVSPFQFLLHYIGTDTSGYGIDFGGGYGYAALLLAAGSKWKFVCTEINFERYKGSIKLQTLLANQAATTDPSMMELKQKCTANVFCMFNGAKSNVEMDWTLPELKDQKQNIFGNTNTTLTPRTASAGIKIPKLISSNNSKWRLIYFFLLDGHP